MRHGPQEVERDAANLVLCCELHATREHGVQAKLSRPGCPANAWPAAVAAQHVARKSPLYTLPLSRTSPHCRRLRDLRRLSHSPRVPLSAAAHSGLCRQPGTSTCPSFLPSAPIRHGRVVVHWREGPTGACEQWAGGRLLQTNCRDLPLAMGLQGLLFVWELSCSQVHIGCTSWPSLSAPTASLTCACRAPSACRQICSLPPFLLQDDGSRVFVAD